MTQQYQEFSAEYFCPICNRVNSARAGLSTIHGFKELPPRGEQRNYMRGTDLHLVEHFLNPNAPHKEFPIRCPHFHHAEWKEDCTDAEMFFVSPSGEMIQAPVTHKGWGILVNKFDGQGLLKL